MSTLRVNEANLYYRSVGEGSETILFSHGFLMNNTMFDGQINALKSHFRCISFDHRGHGQSEVTQEGYTLDNLVSDAIALIEALDIAPVHFVGMSTGGFVGMRIALRRPDLLKSLVLMDTSAEAESASKKIQYDLLVWVVKNIGWWAVLNRVIPILFGQHFLQDASHKAEVEKWKDIVTSHDRQGVALFAAGIFSRDSVLDQLGNITMPTAIIVGDNDIPTNPEYAKRMARAITDADYYLIPEAGHSAAIEKPALVLDAMQDFYTQAGFM